MELLKKTSIVFIGFSIMMVILYIAITTNFNSNINITTINKTAQVTYRQQYHIPWGDDVAIFRSNHFKGFLNLETGKCDFDFTIYDIMSPSGNNIKIDSAVRVEKTGSGYKFSNNNIEGNIISRTMNIWIHIDYKTKT